MKIVVAPDSFKGSLTAVQACFAISEGVARVLADADILQIPMADGGEGTVEALVTSTRGKFIKTFATGPLGDIVEAQYGILGPCSDTDSQTAVIEMAAAAGLPLVQKDKQNPLNTTTYGFGQLILDAVDNHCRDLILGIGGSATNDCGCGMAQALGVKFYDQANNVITSPITGKLLRTVKDIDVSCLDTRLKNCSFTTACDVTNPLLGPAGASKTYGPQKGADSETVEILEANVAAIIDIIESRVGLSVRNIPGAGAAGGLGAALLAFLDASLESGIDIVIRYSDFERSIADADLIITGEGQIDHTTARGKTISGIIKSANRYKIPVIAVAGCLGQGYESLLDIGAKAVFSICSDSITTQQAIKNAKSLLADTAECAIKAYLFDNSD